MISAVIAALAGGSVVAPAALARRTATASPRLERATSIDDARVLVGSEELAGDVTRLPQVERS